MESKRSMLAMLAFVVAAIAGAPQADAYRYVDAGGSCPNGVTWPDSSLPYDYYINEDTASGLNYSPVRSAIEAAYTEWEDACCASFGGSYQGKTTQTVSSVGNGGNNGSSQQIVDWETDSWPQQLGNAAAFAALSYYTSSCEMNHADLVYNEVDYSWNTSGTIGNGNYDVRTVATHEIGHIAGLRHSNTYDATMYAQLHSKSQKYLHQDDEDGICYLYPKGEVCNGQDDNCNGQVDEGTLVQDCSKQEGVCQGAEVSCSGGSYPSCGGSQYGSDYEDPETSCDGRDNDCDGQVDESVERDCSKQEGVCQGATVACASGAFPDCGAGEYGSDYESSETSCDGKDNDCDGQVDEELESTYWRDEDGDGFGTPGESETACPPGPDGYVDNDMDCAPQDPDQPGMNGECDSASDTGMTTSDTGGSAEDTASGSGGDTGSSSSDTGGTSRDTTSSSSPDTGSEGDVPGTTDDTGGSAQTGESLGCGCRAGSSSLPLSPVWMLLAVGGIALRRSRRHDH